MSSKAITPEAKKRQNMTQTKIQTLETLVETFAYVATYQGACHQNDKTSSSRAMAMLYKCCDAKRAYSEADCGLCSELCLEVQRELDNLEAKPARHIA